jgi:aspartyl-tRNA(Asn)/glutamyl-tRNA(Gln) amidotransferase subunit A
VEGLKDGELETALEMGSALAQEQVTVTELVERVLARAEAWQPVTNAFSQVWRDEGLEEARRLDAARSAGTAFGSEGGGLHGVPVAVKDLFDVAGRETTGCCAAYRGRLAERDSPIVERIRAAGLVMAGKTNQHELAAGGTNLVSACGRTGNPWDPSRMTGGSSGGSGAVVAAGIVPLALGSDTGGSIRIPASMCGTFGLKPSTGRLPLEGVLPLCPSMDCPGPMASTVRDLWDLYAVLTGVDRRPPASLPDPGHQIRVGIPDGYFDEFVHTDCAQAVALSAGVFEGAGAVVEPVDGHGIEDAREVWGRICNPEFAEAHPALRDPELRALVAPQVRSWIETGERLTADQREDADRRREQIGEWFRERLNRLDALLVPTTPYPAPQADQATVDLGPWGHVEVDRVGPGWLTCSANLAGLPALNFPGGPSTEGMPVGVSLIGRDGDEEGLFRLALLWEQATGYRPRYPTLPTD